MATVKEINHDSSTNINTHYSSVTDTDGAISVTAPAALDGSTYGVDMDYDAGNATVSLIETFTPVATDQFRCRFRVDLSNLANSGTTSTFCSVNLELNAAGQDYFDVILAGTAGGDFTVRARYYSDGAAGMVSLSGSVALPSSGDVCIELRAIRETADGNADGQVELLVNGVSGQSTNSADNFNHWVFGGGFDRVRLAFNSSVVAFTNNLYYDEWILDDDNAADLGCGLSSLGLAAMTKPADIDAAGEFIYIALLEGGTPILTKISTDLSAGGTTVFDPGAGTNIGVECGRFSSDTVWVAGNFDGTNVVEKSEDGGSTFTVKDDGTIGDVRTFVMGPDSDERILVFDETNGDLLETIDDGATWTAINAAVTPEVNAIARFGKNVQEAVFGNDGAANNSINYTVNSGADLEDFQTGVYPNANATRVIVN